MVTAFVLVLITDRVGTCIGDISRCPIRADGDIRRARSHWDGSNDPVGRSIDGRDTVSGSIGHIGGGPVRRDRDINRIVSGPDVLCFLGNRPFRPFPTETIMVSAGGLRSPTSSQPQDQASLFKQTGAGEKEVRRGIFANTERDPGKQFWRYKAKQTADLH